MTWMPYPNLINIYYLTLTNTTYILCAIYKYHSSIRSHKFNLKIKFTYQIVFVFIIQMIDMLLIWYECETKVFHTHLPNKKSCNFKKCTPVKFNTDDFSNEILELRHPTTIGLSTLYIIIFEEITLFLHGWIHLILITND